MYNIVCVTMCILIYSKSTVYIYKVYIYMIGRALAENITAATQPLSHSEWLSGWVAASGTLDQSGWVAEWLVQSGWGSHSATQSLRVAEWLPAATVAEWLSGWVAAASVRHSESSGLECTIYYPDLIFLRSESMCVTFLEVCVLGL